MGSDNTPTDSHLHGVGGHPHPSLGQHRDDLGQRESGINRQAARVLGWIAAAAGPLAATARRPLAWASWALAAVSAVYIAWAIPSGPGFLVAIGLPLLMLRLPVTGIMFVAVLAQEISPKGHYGSVTTLGNQVFFAAGKVPIILPLAATAALAASARWWPSKDARMSRVGAALLGSALALIGLTTGVGLFNGQSIPSAVNQNARPFILLVLGVIIGVSLRKLPEERKALTVAVGAALTALLVLAAIAIALGASADDRLSRYFVYYDTALPAVAAAVFVALVTGGKSRWHWQHMVVVAATPLLVLVSFRRTVWVAVAVALVAAIILVWVRWRKIVGRLAFAGLIVAVVVLAAPGLAVDLGLRGAATFPLPEGPPVASAEQGERGEASNGTDQAPAQSSNAERAEQQADSANGHVQDLRIGWGYVREHFWTGVGPLSPQLAGLAAVSAPRVYVHNELLQDWLRYGPLAVVLVIILLLFATLLALRALRNPDSDAIDRSAAVFCLMAPTCLITAPFLSDTSRWPLLLGMSAGILAVRRLSHDGRDRRLAPDQR